MQGCVAGTLTAVEIYHYSTKSHGFRAWLHRYARRFCGGRSCPLGYDRREGARTGGPPPPPPFVGCFPIVWLPFWAVFWAACLLQSRGARVALSSAGDFAYPLRHDPQIGLCRFLNACPICNLCRLRRGTGAGAGGRAGGALPWRSGSVCRGRPRRTARGHGASVPRLRVGIAGGHRPAGRGGAGPG